MRSCQPYRCVRPRVRPVHACHDVSIGLPLWTLYSTSAEQCYSQSQTAKHFVESILWPCCGGPLRCKAHEIGAGTPPPMKMRSGAQSRCNLSSGILQKSALAYIVEFSSFYKAWQRLSRISKGLRCCSSCCSQGCNCR
jgi:hypothetical protein